MKKKLTEFIALLVLVIVIARPAAAAEMNLTWFIRDYDTIGYNVAGYEAIVDQWIMAKRNRKFKDNNDFMIVLRKAGDVYTGSDIKIKIVGEDADTVYVKIVRIKGIPGSRRLFKDSDTIDFYKDSGPSGDTIPDEKDESDDPDEKIDQDRDSTEAPEDEMTFSTNSI